MTETEQANAVGVELMLREFVERERALWNTVGKGGQTTGDSPQINPSVLRDLEWMLRNGAEVGTAALSAARQEEREAILTLVDAIVPETSAECALLSGLAVDIKNRGAQ
jgi:hypothetical protein